MKRHPLPSVLPPIHPRHWLCLMLLALLIACGGGLETAGVGTGGTGLKEGNVTGFGSVFIDGVRYDTNQAQVQVDDGSGSLTAGQLKLGQRVRVLVNTAGQVSIAEVLPALLGPVERAPDSMGYLAVMGQWVRFVSSNLPYQSTLSSSTYLDGYTQFTDVSVGDVVEVHGAWVEADPTKGRVLVASRIEKRSTTPARMLVTSTVASVNATDRTFTLTTGDGREVVGSTQSADVSVGDWVKVWLDASHVPQWQPSVPLEASGWGMVGHSAIPALVGSRLEISGLPAQFNTATNTVVVQGISAVVQSDQLSSDNLQALQSGIFSRFVMQRDAFTEIWTVNVITPRQGDSLGRSTALVISGAAGMIQNTNLVRVSGVDVIFGNTMQPVVACDAVDPQVPVTVEIRGTPSGSQVQAVSVVCKLAQPP